VVALKPLEEELIHLPPPLKQERRGGIETASLLGTVTRDPEKQERRGGIETRLGLKAQAPTGAEAGTPWWH